MHDSTPSRSKPVGGIVTRLGDRPLEGWTNNDGSRLEWWTLLSADRDGPVSMCAGVADIPVSAIGLTKHRHEQEELYFVMSGRAAIDINGIITELEPGSCVFVPGNAWHAINNAGPEPLRLFYCFPTASFADVVYEYPPGAPSPSWQNPTI